jgi:hypothetical protein
VESQEATVALQRALVAHANQLESLKVILCRAGVISGLGNSQLSATSKP